MEHFTDVMQRELNRICEGKDLQEQEIQSQRKSRYHRLQSWLRHHVKGYSPQHTSLLHAAECAVKGRFIYGPELTQQWNVLRQQALEKLNIDEIESRYGPNYVDKLLRKVTFANIKSNPLTKDVDFFEVAPDEKNMLVEPGPESWIPIHSSKRESWSKAAELLVCETEEKTKLQYKAARGKMNSLETDLIQTDARNFSISMKHTFESFKEHNTLENMRWSNPIPDQTRVYDYVNRWHKDWIRGVEEAKDIPDLIQYAHANHTSMNQVMEKYTEQFNTVRTRAPEYMKYHANMYLIQLIERVHGVCQDTLRHQESWSAHSSNPSIRKSLGELRDSVTSHMHTVQREMDRVAQLLPQKETEEAIEWYNKLGESVCSADAALYSLEVLKAIEQELTRLQEKGATLAQAWALCRDATELDETVVLPDDHGKVMREVNDPQWHKRAVESVSEEAEALRTIWKKVVDGLMLIWQQFASAKHAHFRYQSDHTSTASCRQGSTTAKRAKALKQEKPTKSGHAEMMKSLHLLGQQVSRLKEQSPEKVQEFMSFLSPAFGSPLPHDPQTMDWYMKQVVVWSTVQWISHTLINDK